MIENKDIICFANDWHSDPTSKHQIMKLLSQKNKVLWVNSIGLRKPSVAKRDIKKIINKLSSFFKGAEKINDNLTVITPVLFPFHNNKLIKFINAKILKLLLKYYIRKLNMKEIIYWSYLPNTSYIIRQMHPEFVIYHCVDEWSKFSFIDSDIINKEKDLCSLANVVIASSKTLFNSKAKFNQNTYYVSHGVDYNHFHNPKLKTVPPPIEIAEIKKKPIAGFFGLIHEWIDLELLEYIINDNPNINFVFIGKEEIDTSRLKAYPNAFFLGQKKYDDLIVYAQHFDVGLIPFKINELTININPIKLKEYFALGIPVVSVDLPEIRTYEKVVRITNDKRKFSEAIKEEISGKHKASPEEIDEIARKENWESKVEEISNIINRFL